MRERVGRLDDWEQKVFDIVKEAIGEDRINAVVLFDDGIDFSVSDAKASMICKIKEMAGIDVDVYANYDGELSIFVPRINTNGGKNEGSGNLS